MTAPTELDERSLDTACEAYDKEWLATELHSKATAAAIRAYLSTLPANGAGWREPEFSVPPLAWEADHGVAGMGPYRLFKAETPLGRFVYGTDAEGSAYYYTASSGIMMVGDEATAKRLAESSWIKAAIAEATKYIDPPSAPDRRAGE